MRAPRTALAAILVASLLAAGAACGGDDDEPAAQDTTEAPAPETTAPDTAPAPPATEEEPAATGDVAAGQSVFQTNCTSCHLEGGRAGGGVGPQLAGRNLTEDRVRTAVEQGPGAMPPNLVSGEDLDNVAAYVVSLQ